MAKTRAEVAEVGTPNLETFQLLGFHGFHRFLSVATSEYREELSRAVQGEDQRRLLAAITAADAAGFTSTEVPESAWCHEFQGCKFCVSVRISVSLV